MVERLSRAARGLRTRPMFGGVGIWADGVFFALIAADVLYLKVDDESRAGYVARGMAPFQPFADKPSMRAYYELPPDVLDDARRLQPWVDAALRAARAAPSKDRKTPSAKRKSTSTKRASTAANRTSTAANRKSPSAKRRSTARRRKPASD